MTSNNYINMNYEINNEYFEWLYNYMCEGRAHDTVSYKKLFALLHNTKFIYFIKNDINRAADGIDLRNRFADDIQDSCVLEYLRRKPCSVLEMLIALAIRCEETIMDNPKYGDRTKQWFWMMLSNLGLSYMTDDLYNENYALQHINIFLNRTYQPNGKGGLFYIRNCDEDLRDIEIWTQLLWYLNNID